MPWPNQMRDAVNVGNMRLAALLLAIVTLSFAPARSAEVATPNDTARFLAGLPPSADSPLTPLTKDPNWQAHANRFNSIFAQQDRGHLGRVRAFSKARLTTTHDTMLYFFSGPDALHAVALFPNATTYVLAGLEPAGNIPPLTEPAPLDGDEHAAQDRRRDELAPLAQLLHHQEHAQPARTPARSTARCR